jgi:hypothetical protein
MNAIANAVQAFSGYLPAPDDQTLIILRRHAAAV